jgi:hypothetical protein
MQIKDLTEFVEIMTRSGLENKCLEADHDVIFGPSVYEIDENVSVEDQKRLDELGWFRDDSIDCLCHYC